jgi:ATP-dependent Clp protease ATP-binding subunit ClpA
LKELPVEASQTIDLSQYAGTEFNQLLSKAAATALSHGATQVEADHAVVAALTLPRLKLIIARLEVPPNQLLQEIASSEQPPEIKALPVAMSTRLLIHKTFSTAIENNYPWVEPEDLVLAYLAEPKPSSSALRQSLESYGIDYAKMLKVCSWYAQDEARGQKWKLWQDKARTRPKSYMNRAWTALPTPFLDSVATDLTLRASYGHLSESVSREKELERLLDTLAGGTVKNVLLIGEEGSGRTDLISAVASKIVEDAVPDVLKDKRLLQLDLNQILTEGDGTTKLQQIINEVVQAGNVILAIPDVKSLAGSGEALDGSSVLAGALKNGDIQVITTSTYSDYHRYVEQNASLRTQLQTVELHQLSISEVVPVLELYLPQLESKHSVTITYPAIETAAAYGESYMQNLPAPAGAKQLLETACLLVKKASKNFVKKQDVERAVESLVHVPVQAAGKDEAEKLLNLESLLHERVVGQTSAVAAVAEAMRRARAGLQVGNRPIGSFLFVGPTGVGKTELAKALCETYFGPESSMQRFDMSEFQSTESITTLIGTPETQGGVLTQAIREKPFGLLLFDELEKAHPEVLNLFLQVLDDGRLTEANGRTVSFKNTIIIATSNAQARAAAEAVGAGANQSKVMQLLEESFKPEFINRFDGVIPFMQLTKPEILQITELLCKDIVTKAAEKEIKLSISTDALEKLAELGFDPQYGARPLRRVVEQKLEGILARLLLEKQIGKGSALQITSAMLD